MTEQLTLTSDPSVITADDGVRLGPSQRDLLDVLRTDGPISADEAGAIVHHRRGRHVFEERCAFCTQDGLQVLESLAKHGLARFGRGSGWVAAQGHPVKPEPEALSVPGQRAQARRSDPPTSHSAAASVGDLRESQAAVLLTFLRRGPMHDEQLQAMYEQQPPQSESGLRTRRRELFDRGLLRANGKTAKTTYGRDSAIWELSDEGRSEAQRLASQSSSPLDAVGF